MWFTLDGQYIVNPAYNKDRGPVKIFGARLHVEL
jgi:high affinity Mn2+ porin